MSHKPDGRLPLLSATPAVIPATLKRAATSFAVWWTEARWVWTVCLRQLPDSVAAAIWTQALLRLSSRGGTKFTLIISYIDLRCKFGIFTSSVRAKLLLSCCTGAVPVPATPTPSPSVVRHTNRPSGYQSRCTKRLVILSLKLSCLVWPTGDDMLCITGLLRACAVLWLAWRLTLNCFLSVATRPCPIARRPGVFDARLWRHGSYGIRKRGRGSCLYLQRFEPGTGACFKPD